MTVEGVAGLGPHPILVAVADCGCLWGAHVLGYGHDADGYRDAANWTKRGAIVTMIGTKAELPPLHCAVHPDGRWDSRGRDKKRQGPTLFREATR